MGESHDLRTGEAHDLRTGEAHDLRTGEAHDLRAGEPHDLTGRPFLQVQMATSSDGRGRIGIVTTDLRAVHVLVQDPEVEGADLRMTTAEHFLDEVVALLPEVPADGGAAAHPRGEVIVAQELSVALAHALKVGDEAQAEMICAAEGFAGVPALLRSLTTELCGSAQVVIRSSDRDDLSAASLLLIPTGWVELAPGPDATICHRPRTLAEVRAMLLSAVTARATTLVAAQGGEH